MAVLLGTRLTKEIFAKIQQESRLDSDEVVLIASVDELGFPNVALLSYLDIAIVSNKRILVAIGENSSTKQNLLREGKGNVVLWVGKNYGVYYIKGKVKLVRERMISKVEGFACSVLIFLIERITRDYSPFAKTLSTLTYQTSRTNGPHYKLFRELRQLARQI